MKFSIQGISGEFCLGVGSPFPDEARKLLEKIGEDSEQNSGQNWGRKLEKVGELSFCNFKFRERPDGLLQHVLTVLVF